MIWLCCLYYGLDFWFTVGVMFGSGCCLVAGCFDFAVLLLIVDWRLFVLCVVWLDCWVSACCFGLGCLMRLRLCGVRVYLCLMVLVWLDLDVGLVA